MGKGVHSGSGFVTLDISVGAGLELLVDDISIEIVSTQESLNHRLVAVLPSIVVVIVNGALVHEFISEK
jgi:hypothetical protein